MAISKEDLNILSEIFDKEVKKAIEAIQKATEQTDNGQRNYFKETEILLYNYPVLRDKVDMDEKFLLDPEAVMFPRQKSKDLVRYSSSGGGVEFDIDQYTASIKASMLRTKAEVLRIERALNLIKVDKYYRIIELKYLEKKNNQDKEDHEKEGQDNYTYEEIAEKLGKDESTIRRNKNRLVNKLKLYLFGAEALTS